MKDSRIEFEERYISEEYGTTTCYFIIDKSMLEQYRPGKYPEAEHGTISIEYPTECPDPNLTSVMISPTKDGMDYDWTALGGTPKFVESLFKLSNSVIRKDDA